MKRMEETNKSFRIFDAMGEFRKGYQIFIINIIFNIVIVIIIITFLIIIIFFFVFDLSVLSLSIASRQFGI